jgi:hypothetical protein
MVWEQRLCVTSLAELRVAPRGRERNMRPIYSVTPALVVVLCGGVLGSGGCSGGREEAGLGGAGGAGGANGMGVGMGIAPPPVGSLLIRWRSSPRPG